MVRDSCRQLRQAREQGAQGRHHYSYGATLKLRLGGWLLGTGQGRSLPLCSRRSDPRVGQFMTWAPRSSGPCEPPVRA
jgi:hypothetical protein